MKATKYYGILPERKLWAKIAAFLLEVLSIYQVLAHQNWFYAPFGLVTIFASFSERKQIISDQGMDIEYRVLGYCFRNLWTYEEIQATHKDSPKSVPRVEIHSNEGSVNRRFIFSSEDARTIEDPARGKKPKIKILEVNHGNQTTFPHRRLEAWKDPQGFSLLFYGGDSDSSSQNVLAGIRRSAIL